MFFYEVKKILPILLMPNFEKDTPNLFFYIISISESETRVPRIGQISYVID